MLTAAKHRISVPLAFGSTREIVNRYVTFLIKLGHASHDESRGAGKLAEPVASGTRSSGAQGTKPSQTPLQRHHSEYLTLPCHAPLLVLLRRLFLRTTTLGIHHHLVRHTSSTPLVLCPALEHVRPPLF